MNDTKTEDSQLDAVNDSQSPDEPQMSASELLGWIEFGCWAALAMTPILYLINGPSVSFDQTVMRCLVVLAALAGGVGLAFCRIKFKNEVPQSSEPSEMA